VNGALAAVSKALDQLIQTAKPYKEKYPALQKAATKLREKIVNKVKTAYESTREDLNELLPYPEVKEFLENGIEYFESALLKPEEATPEKRDAVTRKLEAATTTVIKETFSADFQKGHIEAKVRFPFSSDESDCKHKIYK
jgi:vacuolar-type H+-ATPase subunit E/Vma4